MATQCTPAPVSAECAGCETMIRFKKEDGLPSGWLTLRNAEGQKRAFCPHCDPWKGKA